MEEVIEAVCAGYGVSRESLLRRQQREAFTCAVYLLRRAANRPLREVADLFMISVPRVSQIQSGVEQGENRERFEWILSNHGLNK